MIEQELENQELEIVCWPESQLLMECEGFEENCTLILSEEGMEKYGSSAYYVNKNWLNSTIIEK